MVGTGNTDGVVWERVSDCCDFGTVKVSGFFVYCRMAREIFADCYEATATVFGHSNLGRVIGR